MLDLGHVKLVVHSEAPLAMKPSFYGDVGLQPWRADICVVKSLFPFRMYFALHNRKTIYARTRGATDFDAVRRCEFDLPTHPKDEVAHWRPTDRIRRLARSLRRRCPPRRPIPEPIESARDSVPMVPMAPMWWTAAFTPDHNRSIDPERVRRGRPHFGDVNETTLGYA